MPGTKLQEHVGNEKSWVWSTIDFADESQKMELFCIRFASKERECLRIAAALSGTVLVYRALDAHLGHTI